MKNPRVVVTGVTGFLGQALLGELARRETAPIVVGLSRNASAAAEALARQRAALEARGGDLVMVPWDPETSTKSALVDALGDSTEVYHLAGEPVVGRRYTEALKTRILESRVGGALRIVEAIGELRERPRVLVSASGVGYYGPRDPSEPLDETAQAGSDFLALVCVAWEAAARAAEKHHVRAAQARLGIVLGRGGALAVMQKPIRLFVGGKLGSGQQAVSWIHIDDAARALVHVAAHDSLSGPVNFATSSATTNAELTRAIGRVLGRPTPFWVPEAAIRLVLGEGAEPLLTGQRAVPMRLLQTGFSFRYPNLDDALAASL